LRADQITRTTIRAISQKDFVKKIFTIFTKHDTRLTRHKTRGPNIMF
ncbi:MAG: hypothetical protein ACI8RD_006601, partial [Bacillariaceae sp.]